MTSAAEWIQELTIDVPDFPKPGIVFKDLTPVFAHPLALPTVVNAFAERYDRERLAAVVAIESRGFILGAPLAIALGVGLVLVRKPNKLPREVRTVSYEKEYGTDTLAMHVDALGPSDRVVVVDDLLATGGTAAAAKELVQAAGADLLETAFVMELGFLPGRAKVGGDVFSLAVV